MADLNLPQTGKSGRTAARALRVDMTPMVDLGFLLITFFIFTSIMYKPSAMQLILPRTDGDPSLSAESKTLTLLLDKNQSVVAYEGIAAENARPVIGSMEAGSTSVRDIIIAKQQQLKMLTGSAAAMVVIIKPGMESTYQNLMAVLDEMAICDVKKHAIATMDGDDEKLLHAGR